MAQAHQAFSPNEVLPPTCAKCRAPMSLRRFSPGRFDRYMGTFRCETCSLTRTEAIKFGKAPDAA